MAIERRDNPPPPVPIPRAIGPAAVAPGTSVQRQDFADAMRRAGGARETGAATRQSNWATPGSAPFDGLPTSFARPSANTVVARQGGQSGGQTSSQNGGPTGGQVSARSGGMASGTSSARSELAARSSTHEPLSQGKRNVEASDEVASENEGTSDRNSNDDSDLPSALPGLLATMPLRMMQAIRSTEALPGMTLRGGLTPESLSALFVRCSATTIGEAGGDWHFRLVGDGHGIESLRLQQAAQGGWRVRIALRPGVDETVLDTVALESALESGGHRVDGIVIDAHRASEGVGAERDPVRSQAS